MAREMRLGGKERMKTGVVKIGLVAALGVVGLISAGGVYAGQPRVISTIQTGATWEPLGREEPLTVPEVHFRVKHSPFKSELVRYGQFQFNDAAWSLQGSYSCAVVIMREARQPV